jgi:hypothetical protein
MLGICVQKDQLKMLCFVAVGFGGGGLWVWGVGFRKFSGAAPMMSVVAPREIAKSGVQAPPAQTKNLQPNRPNPAQKSIVQSPFRSEGRVKNRKGINFRR